MGEASKTSQSSAEDRELVKGTAGKQEDREKLAVSLYVQEASWRVAAADAPEAANHREYEAQVWNDSAWDVSIVLANEGGRRATEGMRLPCA